MRTRLYICTTCVESEARQELVEKLRKVQHYLRYGDGQMQGMRAKPDENKPSVATERSEALYIIDDLIGQPPLS